MATTHREPGARLVLTLGLLAACWPVHAQSQAPQQALRQGPSAAQATPEGPAPEPTTQIQPMVDVMLTATNNGYIGTTSSDTPKKDLILNTTVGANINIKGADSQLQGNWRFTSYKYARSTQPSDTLPAGRLDLHSDLYRKEVGIDASVSSEQRPRTVGNPVNANGAGNATTDSRLSLSPFLFRQFDGDSSLLARLGHTWTRSSKNDGNQPDENGVEDAHLIRWERRPARLGYEVEGSFTKTPKFLDPQSGIPDYQTRKKVTLSPLYALTPEVVAGPLLGRDANRFQDKSRNGVIRGAQMRWHPNDRTVLNSQLTHSVFGKEWKLDVSYKTASTVFTLISRREANAQVNRPSTTLPLSQSAPITPTDLGLVATEDTTGRAQFVGHRDDVSLSAGLNRTTPLEAGIGLRTKTYFFEAAAGHKLTPLSKLSGSLRWTRGSTFADTGPQLNRDFTAKLEVSTKLARDTTARMGLRRQLTHTANIATPPPIRSGAESAAYVGLGYSF